MSFLDKTQYITPSARQTKALGQKLGKELLRKLRELREKRREGARVLALEGQLGSGKTTFIQGLAKGLGIKEKITSPTFVLIKRYRIPNPLMLPPNHCRDFYHIDCYRIKKSEEMEKLGIKKIWKDSSNIAAIEWADRVKKLLPGGTIRLIFNFKKHGERVIKVIQ